MKQLTCEMCGSTDLVKQDGVFVCQSCGCKYSIEEAKKMMIEGTVDVSGSEVKIDSSKQLENLRTLAYRAKEANDTESAAKYFEQIRLEDPDDWEANFYSVLYSASNCKIAQIGQAALRVGNALDSVFALIVKQYSNTAQVSHEGGIESQEDENSKTVLNALLTDMQTKSAYTQVINETVNFLAMLVSNVNGNFGSTLEMRDQRINDWMVPIIQAQIMLADGVIRHFKDIVWAEKICRMAQGASSTLALTQRGRETNKIVASRLTEVGEMKKIKAQEETKKYWDEHAEEKAALEQERASLRQQLESLEAQFRATPERTAVEELVSKINALSAERGELGLFKIKERRAFQEQIEALGTELSGVQERVRKAEAEISKKMVPIRARILEIDATLSSTPQ